MKKRAQEEVVLDLSANRSSLHRADSENVAAQYAARMTQEELDRLKQRHLELSAELEIVAQGSVTG